jgi:transcription initiation factor TFIID subunit TAF12
MEKMTIEQYLEESIQQLERACNKLQEDHKCFGCKKCGLYKATKLIATKLSELRK